MNFSPEDLAEQTQPKGANSESTEERVESSTPLEPLLNLLNELNILSQTQQATSSPKQPPTEDEPERVERVTSLLVPPERPSGPTMQGYPVSECRIPAGDRSGGQPIPVLSPSQELLALSQQQTPIPEQAATEEVLESLPSQRASLSATVEPSPATLSASEADAEKTLALIDALQKLAQSETILATDPAQCSSPVAKEPAEERATVAEPPQWRSQPAERKEVVVVSPVEAIETPATAKVRPSSEPQPVAEPITVNATPVVDPVEPVDSEEGEHPLDKLQNLIFGSKMSELESVKNLLKENDLPGVRKLLESIDRKLGNLEHQIYDPDELIKLMLPSIAEILSIKVSESKQDIVRVIVPIIDEVILAKTREDKEAMSGAIAELLPEAISKQIENSPATVAKAIAPEIAVAIQEQIRLDQESIAEAIAPEMGRAIKAQIEIERDAMVDALYPVIGNTIAKYMAEAIRTINEKVANAFSIEGVQRKIRAKVQGVSEAELILKESIPFTIQAAFLIHKASGLVIASVQSKDHQEVEAEMVAGMLTAIRSFVNDCIVQPGEISELNEIEYGDSKIILEVAGYCYLAVIIKGEPPKEFIAKIRETLSTIILKYGKPIERFDGDTSIIPERVLSLVENLIKPPAEEKEDKFPLALTGLIAVVLSAISIPWGIYQYHRYLERLTAANVATALASAPELSVYRLTVDVQDNELILAGRLPNQNLRKKAEKIASFTAPTMQLHNQIIAVHAPPDPVLTASEVQRVATILNRMEGVAISARYDEQRVTVEGTVMQMADAKKIAQSFKQIPGVQSVISTVKLNPLTITTRIYFDGGSATLNPAYGELIDNIREFLKQYPQKHLKIKGHSDRSGSSTRNQQLAQQRSEAVRDALVQRGVDPKRLQVVAIPNPPDDIESPQPLLLSRCVIFEPIAQGIKKK
ncbi:MAG: OmpA family protein [Actinomycetota bacterium]